jgi:hypothetical protein
MIMPEIEGHRQRCSGRTAAVPFDGHGQGASGFGGCHVPLVFAELRAAPGRRPDPIVLRCAARPVPRTRRPQVEAPEVEAEVIPLRAKAAGRKVDPPVTQRVDAA